MFLQSTTSASTTTSSNLVSANIELIVSDLQSKFSDLQTQISDIVSLMDSYNQTSITTSVTAITDQINKLSSGLTTATGNISNINTAIASLSSNNSKYDQLINDFNQKITTINSSFLQLNEKISSLQLEITDQDKKMASFQTSYANDLSATNSKLTSLSASLSASATRLSELNSFINKQSDQFNTVISQINAKITQQNDSFAGQIAATQELIESKKKEISSTIDEKLAPLSSSLTSMKDYIEKNLAVNFTQMGKGINDLEKKYDEALRDLVTQTSEKLLLLSNLQILKQIFNRLCGVFMEKKMTFIKKSNSEFDINISGLRFTVTGSNRWMYLGSYQQFSLQSIVNIGKEVFENKIDIYGDRRFVRGKKELNVIYNNQTDLDITSSLEKNTNIVLRHQNPDFPAILVCNNKFYNKTNVSTVMIGIGRATEDQLGLCVLPNGKVICFANDSDKESFQNISVFYPINSGLASYTLDSKSDYSLVANSFKTIEKDVDDRFNLDSTVMGTNKSCLVDMMADQTTVQYVKYKVADTIVELFYKDLYVQQILITDLKNNTVTKVKCSS